MKSSGKRAISVILAVLMVLSMAVTGLAAAKNQTFDRSTEGTEKVITGYNAAGDEGGVLHLESYLKATERVDGKFKTVEYTFTGVADNAFNTKSVTVNDATRQFIATVKELIVDEGIEDIGVNAFANMPALEKVTFKGNVWLDEGAFVSCANLKTVIFEKDVVIGDGAFSDCTALTNLTLKGAADVREHAFASCSKLKEVVFDYDAVIGKEAFSGCSALTTLVFNSDVVFEDGALNFTINLNDILFSDSSKITGYNNLDDTKYIKDYPVDFIMKGSTLVYYKGNDEEVTIPLNVTAIGPGAFEGNKTLRTVNISKYVDTLGDRAFYNCRNLRNVNYAVFGSIKNIGTDVFTGSPYYEEFDGDFFTIGTVLIKYMGEDAIVNIPNTITKIVDDCFMGSYASRIPDGHTWVVSGIFVPASVAEVGENSFALAQLDDGSYYVPKIFAYEDTVAMSALTAAGYEVVTMPKLADVDGNGIVDTEDARRALRMSVGLDFSTDPRYAHAADVNGDGKVTSADARTVLRLAILLEYFTPEDLLYMPMTKVEILMYYAKAMSTAYDFNAGYTKTTSNKVVNSDMCTAASSVFYSVLAKKGASNETKTYEEKTQAALDNLYVCTLNSVKNIEKATCVLGEDGNYTISIKFKKVHDNFGNSDIVKILPAKTRNYFADSFRSKSWWNGTRESNALTKFDLTYVDCSVDALVRKKDTKIDEVTMKVGYYFAMDGRINGLAISSQLWKTGDATLTRMEETKYNKFAYQPILSVTEMNG